ncbi:ATP synthase subunit I [Salinisphaera sp. SPP-AMP-43]|uniref:ATP synthase subunit I n=1 Tax=Salinisphaera sp. SPP-AMP-43 TaxID=3121288 RepID=UPI003C6E415A
MKRRGVLNLLFLQFVIVAVVAAIIFFVRVAPGYPVLAALYGGAMAIGNTLLLVLRTRRAGAAKASPQAQTMGLMIGMFERLAFTLVGFGIGMGWLRLDPLALLVGFGCAQLAYIGGGASLRQMMPGAAEVKR